MVAQHFRWDFVGLSTDTKPTPETSEKVVDGSTFYCSDTSKLYVFCKDDWYERKPLGGGGGGTTYTAGDGIDITDDTISVDTDTIQEKLTAGTGIDITDNTISATGGGGGGAITELTADDYDVTISHYEGIALWRLNAGLYHTANNVQAFAGNDGDFRLTLNSHLIIIDDSGNQKLIKVIGDDFTSSSQGIYKGFAQYRVSASDGSGALAQSDSVVSTASMMKKIGFAPTSSDVGFLGQLWYDSINNKLYINVNRPADYSGNWKEITIS